MSCSSVQWRAVGRPGDGVPHRDEHQPAAAARLLGDGQDRAGAGSTASPACNGRVEAQPPTGPHAPRQRRGRAVGTRPACGCPSGPKPLAGTQSAKSIQCHSGGSAFRIRATPRPAWPPCPARGSGADRIGRCGPRCGRYSLSYALTSAGAASDGGHRRRWARTRPGARRRLGRGRPGCAGRPHRPSPGSLPGSGAACRPGPPIVDGGTNSGRSSPVCGSRVTASKSITASNSPGLRIRSFSACRRVSASTRAIALDRAATAAGDGGPQHLGGTPLNLARTRSTTAAHRRSPPAVGAARWRRRNR